MKTFLENTDIVVEHIDHNITFDIIVDVYQNENHAQVRIANFHTNLVHIEKNGEIVPKSKYSEVTIQDEDVIEVVSFVGGG